MKYLTLIILLVASQTIGCASTGVVPMSQDSYYIGKKDGSPGLGVSLSNKAQVYKEAHAFCIEKNLELYVLREIVTPSAPAQFGSTELHFKCIAPGGTAQALTKDPDTIIQINK